MATETRTHQALTKAKALDSATELDTATLVEETISKMEAKRFHSSSSHASSGVSSAAVSSRNETNPSQEFEVSMSSRLDSSELVSSGRLSKSTDDGNDIGTLPDGPQPLPEGFTEDRFRVDRKRLEVLLSQSVKIDNNSSTANHLTRAEAFFLDIINTTGCQVSWPSRLKIGAKSKKDPHIKITGPAKSVASAKEKILQQLDSKSSRVTIKMDVCHTDHSHVIGKGGSNIKSVMTETECHIHFPDSNRNSNVSEKSNQVSIAGQASGVEMARQRIRELLPVTLFFDYPTKHISALDLNSPSIQQIVQTYNISIQIKSRRPYSTVVQVRGCVSNQIGLKDGIVCLMQILTGQLGQTIPVRTSIEIQNVQSFMNAKSVAKIKALQASTGITIDLPTQTTTMTLERRNSGGENSGNPERQVVMTGSCEGVLYARQEIISHLPLVLMFDLKQDVSSALAQSTGEKYECFISIKSKAKQATKSCIIKSSEANVYNMFKARQTLMNIPYNGLEDIQMPVNTASFLFSQMQNSHFHQTINPLSMVPLPTIAAASNTSAFFQSNQAKPNFAVATNPRNEPLRITKPMQISTKSCNTSANPSSESKESVSRSSSNAKENSNQAQITRQPHPPPATPSESSCSSGHSSRLRSGRQSSENASQGFNKGPLSLSKSNEGYSSGHDCVSSDLSDSENGSPTTSKDRLNANVVSESFYRPVASSSFKSGPPGFSLRPGYLNKPSFSKSADKITNEVFLQKATSNIQLAKAVRTDSSGNATCSTSSDNSDMQVNPCPASNTVQNTNQTTPKRFNARNNVSGANPSTKVNTFQNQSLSSTPRCCTLEELFNSLGLDRYIEKFEEQEIDIETFQTMSDSDLRELGVNTFGARRKMSMAIKELAAQQEPSTCSQMSGNTRIHDQSHKSTTRLTLRVGQR